MQFIYTLRDVICYLILPFVLFLLMQTHYVLLLSSFKEQLQQHVRVHAMEAVMACWELEQSLQSLTGDIIVYSVFLFCQFSFLFDFIPLVACLSFVSSC